MLPFLECVVSKSLVALADLRRSSWFFWSVVGIGGCVCIDLGGRCPRGFRGFFSVACSGWSLVFAAGLGFVVVLFSLFAVQVGLRCTFLLVAGIGWGISRIAGEALARFLSSLEVS